MENENIVQKFVNSNDYKIEKAIIDGELLFEMILNGKLRKFRVRTPQFKEKIHAEENRKKLYLKLLGDKDYYLRDKLIEKYAEKGLDIKGFDNKFEEVQNKINEKYLALDKLRVEEKNKEKSDEIKKKILEQENEITNLINEQMFLFTEKYKWMQYSIEDQVKQHYIIWLSILCVDIFDEEKQDWTFFYNSMEDWENGKEEVNNIISYYSGYMFLYKGELSND